MKVLKTVESWREIQKEMSGTLGFVPTMGALHEGHAALLRRSKKENNFTLLSIFVNPTQFNDPSDLENYPSHIADDLILAQDLDIDFVFMPSYEMLYSDNYRFKVSEDSFSNELCGKSRPGHFDGVLTVVLKLLNIIQPKKAYFGEKDFQQYLLIRDMCESLFLDVEIIPCPIVREESGLALSSRNLRLNESERTKAAIFHRILSEKMDDEKIREKLQAEGFSVDYVESKENRRFGAIHYGPVRLIDNVEI